MTKHRKAESDSSAERDKALLAEFGDLWAEADDLWERQQDAHAFHGYVSADYRAVYESFARLQGRVLSVLECGSGLGIVTIMASRMGYEAYGIEAESDLVEYSESFARAYGPKARFARGSFIPDGFQRNPAGGDEVVRTMVDCASAYDKLDMQLRDFDLIYAYPWPDEHTLYHNIMRQFARPDAMLLIYDERQGLELVRVGDK